MSNSFNVSRFSFVGGRARPVVQEMTVTGVNSYDERQIVFTVPKASGEGSSHVMAIKVEDIATFAAAFKAAVGTARTAPDTTPAEARKKLDARKATQAKTAPAESQSTLDVIQALQAELAALKAAQTVTSPVKPTKRTTTHVSPAKDTRPKEVPVLDDLDEISTTDLEAVSNIMAILLGKRGAV